MSSSGTDIVPIAAPPFSANQSKFATEDVFFSSVGRTVSGLEAVESEDVKLDILYMFGGDDTANTGPAHYCVRAAEI